MNSNDKAWVVVVICVALVIICGIGSCTMTKLREPMPTDPLAQQLREEGSASNRELIIKRYYENKP